MMTVKDVKLVLKMLTANYGEEFYKGTNEEDVVRLWSVQFANDDQQEVMQAVQNCIATLSYKPRIADIRKRMASNVMRGQMTSIEAFNTISKAVDEAYDRTSAAEAYNSLPPILRKLVGTPSKLISWHRISDDAFQTVIMSAIRESYRELAQREAEYHALPRPLQANEKWRVDAPQQTALPEPETVKSIEQIIADANAAAADHGMTMTDDLREKHSGRLDAFLAPMTEKERLLFEAKEKKKEADRLERMRA